MRADMHEVVIERPRNGMRGPRRAPRWDLARHEPEQIPQRESTSRHRGGTKHLSDLLGPLKRFLDGAVGRPWDDVYSELRSGLSPRSLLHNHILEHVRSMVGLDGYRWGRFEICPRTGILKRQAGSWRTLRDPARGDHVSPRTFLLRRVGRPWVDVAAALVRAGASERGVANIVSMGAVRVRYGARPGRICAWNAATETSPAGPGAPLQRGALYVEAGVLGVVR